MIIKNKTRGKQLATKAFKSRFMGLMFRRITGDEACILTNEYNNRLNAGIHMLFVPQELDILWLNEDKVVVDKKHCLKWCFYWPSKKAKYVIELLNDKSTCIGDELMF